MTDTQMQVPSPPLTLVVSHMEIECHATAGSKGRGWELGKVLALWNENSITRRLEVHPEVTVFSREDAELVLLHIAQAMHVARGSEAYRHLLNLEDEVGNHWERLAERVSSQAVDASLAEMAVPRGVA